MERPEVIQDYLAHSTPPATNFIYCWDLRGHDFFGQWEHHQGRVSRVFVDLYNGKSREVEGLSRPPPKVRVRKRSYILFCVCVCVCVCVCLGSRSITKGGIPGCLLICIIKGKDFSFVYSCIWVWV